MTNLQSKRIVAFDLDGTLTDSKQLIGEDMAKIIIALAEKVKVGIISGGSYSQFKNQFIPQIVESSKSSGDEVLKNIILLPTSGSRRYEYNKESKDWQEAAVHPFSEEIRKKVIEFLNQILAERKDEFGIPEEHFGEYIEDRITQVTFSGLGQSAPLDKKQLWDPDNSKRKRIKEYLESNIKGINANIGGTTSIDILPKGFEKASGLKILLDDLNLNIEDMLFIGDAVFPGGNDYSPKEIGIETIGISGPNETKEAIRRLLEA